eukprot:TRINITY_DN14108_c0_g1_i1.p1 TRINITY_DN14108_c0_g1~~TRINITY_DN14108_c0_g1_i1.p1  ORF type:complete len:176 (-),score=16.99 TRINITY_DN14108_c0_g1_i1:86-613(-)
MYWLYSFLLVGLYVTLSHSENACSTILNTDFYGGDLEKILSVPSVDDCCMKCSTKEHCKAFTYVSYSQLCMLKVHDSDKRTATGVTSGLLLSAVGSDSGSIASGLSGGSIFLIVVFSLLAIYLIIGVIYNKLKNDSEGLQLIPNYDGWSKGCGLVQDGLSYTFSKIRNTVSGDGL